MEGKSNNKDFSGTKEDGLKQKSGATLDKLQSSLLVFRDLRGHLNAALMSMQSKDRIEDELLLLTVTNHIHILVCSFLEEWARFESLGEDYQDITKTRKIVLPAIKRIREWKGLLSIRHWLLAHPHRNKKGEYLPWAPRVFNDANAPTSFAEINLLGNLAYSVIEEFVLVRHKTSLEEADKITRDMYSKQQSTGIHTTGEINSERKRIGDEMRAIERSLSNCFI